MKKTGIVLLMSVICLSGCNTATTEEDKTSSENVTENVKDTSSENLTEGVKDSSSKNNSNSSSQNSEENIPTLDYTIGNEKFSKELHNGKGEEFDYLISLTEDFYLTAEEPGADMVVYKNNEALMMRVELVSTNDATYEQFEEETIDLLEAATNHSPYEAYTLPSEYDSLKNANGYIIENESDKLIIVTFEQEDSFVRLTIFDDYITNVSEALLLLGASIHPEK